MAISIVSLDDLELSFSGDKEDPKTVFVIKPFTQFEYMRVAGTYQKCLGDLEDDDENSNKMVELFTTEKGDPLKDLLTWFFTEKIKEVKNIKDKEGKLVTLSVDKLSIDMFEPISLIDILSQSMAEIVPDEKEIKN